MRRSGLSTIFQVSNLYTWDSAGIVQFHFDFIQPHPNDDFVNAKIITSLPFDDTVDTLAAGKETDEPKPSCASDQWSKTAWYAFTPTTSGSVTAGVPWANFASLLGIYTGNALTNLTELGCSLGNVLTFHANAGTTYYFQIGNYYSWESGGFMQFHLDVAPRPVTGFYYSPSDPSVFDTIQFYDASYDPVRQGSSLMPGISGTGQHPHPPIQPTSMQKTATIQFNSRSRPLMVARLRPHRLYLSGPMM